MNTFTLHNMPWNTSNRTVGGNWQLFLIESTVQNGQIKQTKYKQKHQSPEEHN